VKLKGVKQIGVKQGFGVFGFDFGSETDRPIL